MRRIAIFGATIAAILSFSFAAAPAQAQATRTWVSGVGDDANPCSRTAPCKTFAGAISKTATGGEINCIDPGGFGALTITKAITINCENTLGSVLVSGTNGIIINAPTGSKVTLKGIEIEGLGTGLNAISVLQGVILHIHKVQIRNFTQNGINWVPNSAGELYVNESWISDCGVGAGTGGIIIEPAVGGTTSAVIENVKLENNLNGVVTAATNGVGVNVQIKNTSAVGAGSGNGFFFSANSTNVVGMLQNVVSNNNLVGLAVSNGAVRIGGSMITANSTGVSFTAGSLTSYKNNQIDANPTPGTPIPQVNFN